MFNGDFSLSLEDAQKAKHLYILNGIQFVPGDRVLDIGCRWGPMLSALKDASGEGIGLTISPAQAKTGRTDHVCAELKDWRDIKPKNFGKFDGFVSIGAFEAFCRSCLSGMASI